ncbi:hypothetical protein Y032_0262g569 [Ancylostoma ceylanicum]|uniref:Uncharacterized protein n=1 Tax=Ancylostoma ceylanicum TaxID=53326 RepID=A0A016S9Y8_9BILA|nr:hypothetical protein Y032_0262g569 [Ancylostoma ceylanicum]
MVKVRADSSKIDEKMGTITWVGIDEKANEDDTRRSDQEIIREVVLTSGNEDLIRELDAGRIIFHRHPVGKPRGPSGRGRIIKIRLAKEELRDALLSHMKSGRQSLTEQFVHSFARRDYTMEELNLDRALRKRAGDLNALEGKLIYIVRDFDIIKLKYPRELPRHLIGGSTTNSSNSSSGTNITRVTTRSQSRTLNHSSFATASHNQTAANEVLSPQVVRSQLPCSSSYLA